MISPIELERLAELIADKVSERLAGQSSNLSADSYLDGHGVAELLGCSVPTVERLTKAGKLQSIKLGRLRRYRRSDVLSMTTEVQK